MKRLTDIGTIKQILIKYGFNFSKAFGQNFLINPNVCPKMAEMCGIEENTAVLEIGPGIGVLTCELAKKATKVVAIEIDKRLIPVLSETLSDFENVKIINDDIMKINLKSLFDSEFLGMDVVVCANLPYYITSPVLMRLLETKLNLNSITVMVQKEVAQRICAGAGQKNSSSISVAINYYAKPELLFFVKRGSFMPTPKVDSAVIRLIVRKTPVCEVLNEELFFKIVKSAFLQRRKTLINSLNHNLNLSKDILIKALKILNISSSSRAENLSIEQFAKLSNFLYKHFNQ